MPNRPIHEIKDELARLQKIKDESNPETYAHKKANIRYWAIRWVMGWEKEIPEVSEHE